MKGENAERKPNKTSLQLSPDAHSKNTLIAARKT